ncbi:hypothetical protein [Bacillus sp. NEB1478]|uniref:hypothetical protein n=1 Tax=Bacillus sp. NEB1478 TaxID=3073816 RepID=UPI002872B9F4|nr:hypothetical protein [Bacillus sp. NEB1478]WNB92615.1 hypothetical protein RGB74_02805 [Bacillus sp. NEB1478]
MDWSMFIGLAVALALLRWVKNELKLRSFLKELIVLSAFVFVFNLISDFIKSKMTLPFSIRNPFSETIQLWIGVIVFFALTCILAFSGWRNNGKKSADTKSDR